MIQGHTQITQAQLKVPIMENAGLNENLLYVGKCYGTGKYISKL